jgi:hypothetical protein
MTNKKGLKNCPICNRPQKHSKRYDAFYCEDCNIWLEPVCGNRNCEFCANRPKNPVRNVYSDLMRGIQDYRNVRQGVIQQKRPTGNPRKNKKNSR